MEPSWIPTRQCSKDGSAAGFNMWLDTLCKGSTYSAHIICYVYWGLITTTTKKHDDLRWHTSSMMMKCSLFACVFSEIIDAQTLWLWLSLYKKNQSQTIKRMLSLLRKITNVIRNVCCLKHSLKSFSLCINLIQAQSNKQISISALMIKDQNRLRGVLSVARGHNKIKFILQNFHMQIDACQIMNIHSTLYFAPTLSRQRCVLC